MTQLQPTETTSAASSASLLSDDMLAIAHFRNQIMDIQQAMMAAVADGHLSTCGTQTYHHFGKGVYIRSVFMPACRVIVGKIHIHDHPTIITKGKVHVKTEDSLCFYDADNFPLVFNSEAGVKRFLFTETDTIWSTIHVTGIDAVVDDIPLLESMFFADSYEEFYEKRVAV